MTATARQPQQPRWHVLNHIARFPGKNMAQRAVDRYNQANGTSLELFAPSYAVCEEKNGQMQLRQVRLAFHYVFLRGTTEQIKDICTAENGFSLLLNRSGAERYATVSDTAMRTFQSIARAYQNCLPYYNIDEVELQSGDLVEVINGDFPGLVGTYLPKAKSKSGQIVLQVTQNLCTVVYNISVSDVRVLRFAPGTTRPYDQIDAIVPRLYQALRLYNASKPLTSTISAPLSIFCSRLGQVKLGNPKLEAKLHALLGAGNYLLGNLDEAHQNRRQFQRRSQMLTNPWTMALIDLLHAVLTYEPRQLELGYARISGQTPGSKAQRQLIEEYAHYLNQTQTT